MGKKLNILAWTFVSVGLWQVLVLPTRDGSVAALFAPPPLPGQSSAAQPRSIFDAPPISSARPITDTPVARGERSLIVESSRPPEVAMAPLLPPPASKFVPSDDVAPIPHLPPLDDITPIPDTPAIVENKNPINAPQQALTDRQPTVAESEPSNSTPMNPLLTWKPGTFPSDPPSSEIPLPSNEAIPYLADNSVEKPEDKAANGEQLPDGTAGSTPSAPTAPPAKDATAREADGMKDKRMGEEPPTTSIDVFRQSAVLLPSGVWECELTGQYTLFEDDFLTILPSSTLVKQRTSSRTGLGTVSLRYGYNDVLQPFVSVPGGISTVEVANQEDDDSNDQYGISDTTIGFNYLVRNGKDECADVVFGLTCVAPTGDANFLSIVPGNASLGNGFWIVSPSLSWTRTYDPVVLYATVAYLHRFEREHLGTPVKPGEEFDIGYGAGFAVNDSLTYSLQFQWAHQFDTEINSVAIDDSGADVATIRQSGIIRVMPQKFVEVFFVNGLTGNSPQVSMGVSLVHRY